jgi:hypothetical protein
LLEVVKQAARFVLLEKITKKMGSQRLGKTFATPGGTWGRFLGKEESKDAFYRI